MLINVLIIVACVSGAILFLLLVTRTSTARSRREFNDFTGAVVAVIGTTYAVIHQKVPILSISFGYLRDRARHTLNPTL